MNEKQYWLTQEQESLIPFNDVVDDWPSARTQLLSWKKREEEGFLQDIPSQLVGPSTRAALLSEVWSWPGWDEQDPILLDYEKENDGKVGPMSYMMTWSNRRDGAALRNFLSSTRPNFSRRAFDRARRKLEGLIKKGSLHRLSVEEAADRIPKNTYSGLPFARKKREVIKRLVSRAQALFDGELELEPAQAGWRSQAGGPALEDVKQRLIMMMDGTESICATAYRDPMVDVLKTRTEFAGWFNADRADEVVTGALSSLDETFFSTDFDSYDSTFSPDTSQLIMETLAFWFGEDISAEDSALRELGRAAFSSKLLTADGLMSGLFGLFSGTGFTSPAGTLGNWFVAEYTSQVLGVRRSFGTYLGDDAVNAWSPSPPLDEVVAAAEELGFGQNMDKQHVSDESIHYLQNLWTKSGVRAVRPIFRAMQGMLAFERPHNPKEFNRWMESVRTINQCENCRNHDLFPHLVNFIKEHDDVIAATDPGVILKKAGGVEAVEDALRLTSYRAPFTDPSGWDEYQTVRALRGQR